MGYVVVGTGTHSNRGYIFRKPGKEDRFIEATEEGALAYGTPEEALKVACRRGGYDPNSFDWSEIKQRERDGHYYVDLKEDED